MGERAAAAAAAGDRVARQDLKKKKKKKRRRKQKKEKSSHVIAFAYVIERRRGKGGEEGYWGLLGLGDIKGGHSCVLESTGRQAELKIDHKMDEG